MRYALLLLLWAPLFAQAAILRVGTGCTYTSIQAALNAAQINDELRLRTQTFVENITISKQITLRGGYSSCTASSPSLFDRATIQSAANGNAVVQANSAGATITLIRLNLIGGDNAGGNGGGLHINNGTRVEVDLVSTTGNSADRGGGIYVAGGNATLAGAPGALALTVSENHAVSTGGGIYVRSGGIIDLLNSPVATLNIDDNTADSQGGALFMSAATVGLANVGFDGNSAVSGGAISNTVATSDGLLEIVDGSFSNNTAVNAGGAIRMIQGSTGGVTLNLTRTSLSGNQLSDSGFGGAVYLSGAVQATFEAVDITGSQAANGAGIALLGSRLTLRGGTIGQNAATQSGGGIYAAAGSQYELIDTATENVHFVGNTAGTNGGAINDISGMNNLIAPDLVPTAGMLFEGNDAGNGGAIYVSSGTALLLSRPTAFVGNTAVSDGGAIYATGNSTIVTTDGYGGTSQRMLFNANVAGNRGGGAYIVNGASATLDWVALGPSSTGGNVAITGGGLYFEGSGELRMRNSVIRGNRADNGGGMFLGNSADVQIGAVIGDNTLPPPPGLPQACNIGVVGTDEYCSWFANNQATAADGRGGAIYALFADIVTLSGVTLMDNQASQGGALAVANPTEMLIENGLIRDNDNAIYLDQNTTLDLYHTTIAANANNTLEVASSANTQLIFRNSILWGNAQGLVGGAGANISGDCNITQSAALTGTIIDPQFISTGRDAFRLPSGSFAVDRCDSGSALDLDGQPRPSGARYDIGAFERTGAPPPDPVFADSFES